MTDPTPAPPRRRPTPRPGQPRTGRPRGPHRHRRVPARPDRARPGPAGRYPTAGSGGRRARRAADHRCVHGRRPGHVRQGRSLGGRVVPAADRRRRGLWRARLRRARRLAQPGRHRRPRRLAVHHHRAPAGLPLQRGRGPGRPRRGGRRRSRPWASSSGSRCHRTSTSSTRSRSRPAAASGTRARTSARPSCGRAWSPGRGSRSRSGRPWRPLGPPTRTVSSTSTRTPTGRRSGRSSRPRRSSTRWRPACGVSSRSRPMASPTTRPTCRGSSACRPRNACPSSSSGPA